MGRPDRRHAPGDRASTTPTSPSATSPARRPPRPMPICPSAPLTSNAGDQRRRSATSPATSGFRRARPATSSSTRAATACTPWSTRSATRSACRTRAPTTPRPASRSPTRANAEYSQDTRAYTVMSYFDAELDRRAPFRLQHLDARSIAATPLIHDIARHPGDLRRRHDHPHRRHHLRLQLATPAAIRSTSPRPRRRSWRSGTPAASIRSTPRATPPPSSIDLHAGLALQHRRRHLRHRADLRAGQRQPRRGRPRRRSRCATYNANMAAAGRQSGGRPPDRQCRHRLWRDHRERHRRLRQRPRSSATRSTTSSPAMPATTASPAAGRQRHARRRRRRRHDDRRHRQRPLLRRSVAATW